MDDRRRDLPAMRRPAPRTGKAAPKTAKGAPPAPKMKLGAIPPSRPRPKGPPPKLSSQIALLAFLGAFFVLIAASLAGSIGPMIAHMQQATDEFVVGSGFGVRNIVIRDAATEKPLLREQDQQIRAALLIEPGETIFRADPKRLRNNIRKLNFVADAAVARDWPDRIRIDIRVRRAYAIMETGAEAFVIAADGHVLALATDPNSTLPRLRGPFAHMHAREIVGLLNERSLAIRDVAYAEWVDNRRWRLQLHGGLRIELPEEGAELALRRLASFDPQTQKRLRELARLDFRTDNRMRLLPRSAPASAASVRPPSGPLRAPDPEQAASLSGAFIAAKEDPVAPAPSEPLLRGG